MQPIRFTKEDTLMLPPHVAVTYAENQTEYVPLPVVRLEGEEGRVISRWSLTVDERARIAAGEDFFLEQLTFGEPLQPIRPSVGLREFCPADVGAMKES